MICDFPNTTKETQTTVNTRDTAGLCIGHVMSRVWLVMVMYILLLASGVMVPIY